jgi:biotin carboxyl carrier protein
VRYDVEIDGRPHKVVVSQPGDGFAVTVDARTWHVDAARIDAHLLSLIIGEVLPKGDMRRPGASYEIAVSHESAAGHVTVGIGATAVTVKLNGRRRRKEAVGDTGSGGPQRVVAPMPGKIVRVDVKPGDVVRVRQPLVVVEAMKMENELRAGRDGTIAEIHVKEGASVDAGALLVVIE